MILQNTHVVLALLVQMRPLCQTHTMARDTGHKCHAWGTSSSESQCKTSLADT